MRFVVPVSQQRLETLRSGWQLQHGLRLTVIEMEMAPVPGKGLVQIQKLFHIDQQRMLPRRVTALALGAGRCDPETLDTEPDPEWTFDHRAVPEADKKDPGIR